MVPKKVYWGRRPRGGVCCEQVSAETQKLYQDTLEDSSEGQAVPFMLVRPFQRI